MDWGKKFSGYAIDEYIFIRFLRRRWHNAEIAADIFAVECTFCVFSRKLLLMSLIKFWTYIRRGRKIFVSIFLIYRFRSLIQTLNIFDSRKKDNVILLETEQADEYSLTIIQKSMNLKLAENRAEGFQKYLQYWEGTPDAPLNLYTANAICLKDEN